MIRLFHNFTEKYLKTKIFFRQEKSKIMFKIFNSNKSNGEESPKKLEDKLGLLNKQESSTNFLNQSEKSSNQTAGQ